MNRNTTVTDSFLTETISAGRLRLTLNWVGQQLAEIGLSWKDENYSPDLTSSLSPLAQAVQNTLEAYVAGKAVQWPDLPLALHECSPFTQRVLTILQTIPAGKTVTYGTLAAMAGSPGAARGVGQIMRRNRWPLIIPCHRVIGSGGAMTGFSGTGGIPLKEYLLQLEGARK